MSDSTKAGRAPADPKTQFEVLLAPAELVPLAGRDLRATVCVVFDILRATSTMITALANGARAVIPVAGIPEALAIRWREPAVLLAGERDGLRISTNLTGGVSFDLGNSPREFTRDRVEGKTIVRTTTNGTRALRACAGAGTTLVGSFLNLRAVTRWIEARRPPDLLVVCGGTLDQVALEDMLAAGALAESVWPLYGKGRVADSAHLARQMYRTHQADLIGAMQYSRNGRRLLGHPDLRDDVPYCLERDLVDLLPTLQPDGSVRSDR